MEVRYIEVKISSKEKRAIMVSDILYIEACGKCSVIYMKDGENLLAFHMLKWFENSLPSPCFFRAHYSILVSCNYVWSYKCRCITLNNNMKIPLSRNRLDAFKLNLKSFLENNRNSDQV